MTLPLIVPVGLGLGLLLFAGGSKKAPSSSSSAPSGTKPKTAQDFQTKIVEALARGDAAALMAIANEMQAAGLVAEAESLRTTATTLQGLGALTKPPGSSASPGLPTVPVGAPVVAPSSPLPNPPIAPPPPVIVPPVVVPSTVPLPAGTSVTPELEKRRTLAQSVAMNLRNTSRYQEDQNLVKAFQAQEGLKVDGRYGPKSALALAEYGVIPPRPRYWSSKSMKADKADYSKAMLVFAAADPARAADWTAASKVANDPAS